MPQTTYALRLAAPPEAVLGRLRAEVPGPTSGAPVRLVEVDGDGVQLLCGPGTHQDPGSRVDGLVEPDGDGARLTLCHVGGALAPDAASDVALQHAGGVLLGLAGLWTMAPLLLVGAGLLLALALWTRLSLGDQPARRAADFAEVAHVVAAALAPLRPVPAAPPYRGPSGG